MFCLILLKILWMYSKIIALIFIDISDQVNLTKMSVFLMCSIQVGTYDIKAVHEMRQTCQISATKVFVTDNVTFCIMTVCRKCHPQISFEFPEPSRTRKFNIFSSGGHCHSLAQIYLSQLRACTKKSFKIMYTNITI